MKKSSALLFFFLTVLAAPVMAQQKAGWTLEQAINAALSVHPAILGSKSTQAAAQAELEGAEWQRYPTPIVEASAPDSGSGSTVLRVEQPLWTWGKIGAGIEAAGFRAQGASYAVSEARRDVALRVVNAWTEVQRQQARKTSADDGVKAHENLLGLMQRRVSQEISPKVDEDFARSRLLLARNDRTSIQQALNAALSQLSLLVGNTVEAAVGDLQEKTKPQTLESAVELALASSPTMKRLEQETQAAGQDAKARKSAALPQMSVRLERFMGSRPTGIIDDNRISIVLSAQPGAGLSSRSSVDAAIARQEALERARDVAQLELTQQVKADWEELVGGRARLANAREAASMASQVFDSYTRQFAAGRKTWIDVLNAIREVTQTEYGIADARAQIAAAAKRIEVLSGKTINEKQAHAH